MYRTSGDYIPKIINIYGWWKYYESSLDALKDSACHDEIENRSSNHYKIWQEYPFYIPHPHPHLAHDFVLEVLIKFICL